MAKNWTVAEAINAVTKGDKEAIMDIGRRFPLTLAALAGIDGNKGAITILNAMPDYVTTRKTESILKDGVQETSEEETEDVEEVEEKAPAKAKKAAAKETAAPSKKAAKKAPAEEPEEDEDDEQADYEEMTAMDLFKLCKERKIKAEPKQKAAVYIKLLKIADAQADDNEEEEEDWEEEEPVAKKKAAKPAEKAAPAKKAAKKPVDDDEDWDI